MCVENQLKEEVLNVGKFNIESWREKKMLLENPGIDPGTSRMLSERSTI